MNWSRSGGDARAADGSPAAELRVRAEEARLAYAPDAAALARDAVSASETEEDPAGLAAALGTLAGALLDRGRAGEAGPLLQRALSTLERARGRPDVERMRVTLLGDVGRAHAAQGRWLHAVAVYRTTLGAAERVHGARAPEVVAWLVALGAACEDAARYTGAARALARAQRVLGANGLADTVDAASAYRRLASLARARGRPAEGEPYARRAVALREAALGSDHPEVGRDLLTLAGVLCAEGRHVEAQPLFQRAHEVLSRALGADHPEIAHVLDAFASCRRAQGDGAGAERLLRDAVGVLEAAGGDQPELAFALRTLALVVADAGRRDEAAACLVRAEAVALRTLPRTHPRAAEIRRERRSLGA